MMCFHKSPLVLCYALVMWTLYFSQFFTSFFTGLHRICLRAKVHNLVFIILFIACRNWLWLINWKLHFVEWKTRSFVLKFSSQKAANCILGLWGRMRPDALFPPKRRGLTPPCWYCQLLDSNLLATSIFIETLCEIMWGGHCLSGNASKKSSEIYTVLYMVYI